MNEKHTAYMQFNKHSIPENLSNSKISFRTLMALLSSILNIKGVGRLRRPTPTAIDQPVGYYPSLTASLRSLTSKLTCIASLFSSMSNFLTVVFFIMSGLFDLGLTLIALESGFSEGNPILSSYPFLLTLGKPLITFFIGLFLAYRKAWSTLILATGVNLGVCLSNIVTLIHGL